MMIMMNVVGPGWGGLDTETSRGGEEGRGGGGVAKVNAKTWMGNGKRKGRRLIQISISIEGRV